MAEIRNREPCGELCAEEGDCCPIDSHSYMRLSDPRRSSQKEMRILPLFDFGEEASDVLLQGWRMHSCPIKIGELGMIMGGREAQD